MLFDVTHQEPDDQDADYKCYYAAHCQDQQFVAVKYEADPQNVFYKFQQGSTDHDGNSQIKGELCGYAALQPDQQAADDSGTGTGCARHQGQQLEDTYLDGFAVRDILYVFNASGTDVTGLDQDKQDAIENQGDCYNFRCKEMFLHPVVKQDTDDGGRQAGYNDFSPQVQGRAV